MTETTEQITLEELYKDAMTGTYRPVLALWSGILSEVDNPKFNKIDIGWAHRMVERHSQIKFSDLPELNSNFRSKLVVLRDALEEVIKENPDHLTVENQQEDAEKNTALYFDLLKKWQIQLLNWELAWDPMDPNAAIEIAAISDTHTMIFGHTGITSLLDAIGYITTDAQQQELVDALGDVMNGTEGA